MPLRDHFGPPVSQRASWEGFHGLWPAVIVQQLGSREPSVVCGQVLQLAAQRCLSVVDLVTTRQFSLYTELLALLDRSDPAFSAAPIYAVTCRRRQVGRQTKLDTWSFPLEVGQPLPSLPVWLSETQTVTIDPEASYEEACRVLRIS
jgi:hypothetical protein